MQNRLTEAVICIVELGYVGLPLAEAFPRHFKIIGLDTNIKLVKELRRKISWAQEDLARQIDVSLSTVQRWESKGARLTRLARRQVNKALQ